MHGRLLELLSRGSLGAFGLHALLLFLVQTLSACGPPCTGAAGSCLHLRVEGSVPVTSDAARLTVWLAGTDLAGAPVIVSGATGGRASLPADLRLEPPGSMSTVDSVSVQLLDRASADSSLASGSLLLSGRTQLSWPSGAQIEASVNLSPPALPSSRRVDLPAGENPRSIVVLDADHNGQMDLAVRNAGAIGDSILLLLANADGSFQPAQNIFPRVAGRTLSDLATADLDADQHADLAFADVGTGSVYVLYGKGNGTFTSQVSFPLQTNNPGRLAAADLDADGRSDLLIASKLGAVTIFWNEGQGIFDSRTVLTEGSTIASPIALGSPALVDVNRDGRVDVVGAGKLWVNKGRRAFFTPVPLDTQTNPPFAIAAQDFDGDSWVDLLATDASSNGRLNFLKGDGSGRLVASNVQALGSHPLLAVAAELNGDFIPDLALADQSTVLLALGNGLGGFQPAACPGTICQLPGSAVFARAQDLNADGVPELLFVTESRPERLGTVSILHYGLAEEYRPLIDHRSPSALRENFTLGGVRTDPNFGDNTNGAYVIEQSTAQPVWTPTNFAFVSPQNSLAPSLVQAATGNLGAAGGIAQVGSNNVNFSVQFADTTGNFVVQADAILPEDRFALSSLPYTTASIGIANALTVNLRREVNYYGAPSIGIANDLGETGTGCTIGISDNNWHNYAVNFNKRTNRLFIYVDERVKCAVDLNSFAGGIYKNYSSSAVGMGGNRGGTLMDNFQAGPAY